MHVSLNQRRQSIDIPFSCCSLLWFHLYYCLKFENFLSRFQPLR